MQGNSPQILGRPTHLAWRPAQPLVATVSIPDITTPAAIHEALDRLIEQRLQVDAASIDAADGSCERDSNVPSVQFWQLVLRVVKPGGLLLAFGDSRSYHRMVANVEDAGFEIRDQIIWLTGRAMEPVVLARKPLSEPTVAANVIAHGTGALNIKECRIEAAGDHEGRWPSNLILSEDTRTALGSPARFYYTIPADEDNQRGHTTRPKALIQYLCRLVTPPGGVVLNSLAESVTTRPPAAEERGQAG